MTNIANQMYRGDNGRKGLAFFAVVSTLTTAPIAGRLRCILSI